jgi:hypothetical protein
MSEWRKIYWRFLKIASLVTGVWSVFVGLIFVGWGLSLVLNPKATIDVNGVPTDSPWEKASVLVAGLAGVGVCTLQIWVPLYLSRKILKNITSK